MAIYVRLPWSVGQAFKDAAHERSKRLRKRVSVNDLLTDAAKAYLPRLQKS
jgi:hypothetical protein